MQRSKLNPATRVLRVFTDDNKTFVVAVIYLNNNKESDRPFIAVEKKSSMGFTNIETAIRWLTAFADKHHPLTEADNSYKILPEDVKKDLETIKR